MNENAIAILGGTGDQGLGLALGPGSWRRLDPWGTNSCLVPVPVKSPNLNLPVLVAASVANKEEMMVGIVYLP